MAKVAHGKENTSPKAGVKNPNQKAKNAAHARIVSAKRVALGKEPVRKSKRILKLQPDAEIPTVDAKEGEEDAPTKEDSPEDASSSSEEVKEEEEEDTLTEEELAELFTYTEEEKLFLSVKIPLAPWMQTTLEDAPACKVSVEDMIKASRVKSTCEGTTEVPEEFQIRVMLPNMPFSDATFTSTLKFIAATFDDSSEDSDEDFE